MDFGATSFYPGAIWDKNSVYLKRETGFNCKLHKKKNYLEAFYNKTFNQYGDESTNLKTKFYKPPDLLFQHPPVKEKVKNIEVNRMPRGSIKDTLTSVGIQDIVTIGKKLIRIYEGVIYRKNLKTSPFRNQGKLFGFGQNYKDKRSDLLQGLVKLLMKC